MKHAPRKLLRMILPLVMLAAAAALPAVAQKAGGVLEVMTYNVNEGTDFLQVLSATNADQFLLGVGQIVTQVQGTNPPERMQAVAAQILAARPTLVSLQEVDQWYLGAFSPVTGCGTMSLEYDMLQELTSALAAQGGHYQVVMQVPEITLPPTPGLIPPGTLLCAIISIEQFAVRSICNGSPLHNTVRHCSNHALVGLRRRSVSREHVSISRHASGIICPHRPRSSGRRIARRRGKHDATVDHCNGL